MQIDITPLTLERLDEAKRVWQATLVNGFKLDWQEVADRMQNGTGLFYIAVDNQTNWVVGVKFGYFDGEVCFGRGIGVLPEYRRQGIATRLVRRFEQDLQANPAIKVYAFGSATTEGVPFHIAMGYTPQVLVQFADRDIRPGLDFTGLPITQEGYNDTYQVYQIYLTLDVSQANLDSLRSLQAQHPQVYIQFFFEKALQ